MTIYFVKSIIYKFFYHLVFLFYYRVVINGAYLAPLEIE